MSYRRYLAVAAIWALAFSGGPVAMAQSPVTSVPQVPTTKILAVGHMTSKWTPSALSTVMPQEVRETVELYLAGRIDQWYFRKDQPGVVFIVSARDVDEARAFLEALPLGRAGLMDFDYIPLGPLAPLRGLIAPAPQ